MPELEQTGQPTPEPSPAPVETAPTDAPIPQTPAVPDKLAGRSAEEIASQYLELEKKLGEQGRELGELRQRVSQAPPPQPVYYPPPAADRQEPRFEIDYTKPDGGVADFVERRLQKERQEWQTQQVMTRAQEANYSFSLGRDAALKANPKLYEGIEREVQDAARYAYENNLASPVMLRDQKFWDRLAINLRFETGQLDKVYSKPQVQPPQPSPTAVPNQTRADARVGIELDEETRRWAREHGISEKEAKELIESEAERGGLR